MKTLEQQIEEMRAHVRDLATTERELVKALGEELRRADEELLHAIRRVAAEHEQRRASIVVELQALAERAGLLSAIGRDPALAAIEYQDRPAMSPYRGRSLNLEEQVSYNLKGSH
jgi:hypothetical protein